MPLRASLSTPQGNKIKHYKYLKNIYLSYGNQCSQILNPLGVQLKFTYRVFNERINLCDVGEKFSNRKKPAINLLHEHQYWPNSKLGIREILWKISQKEFANKQGKKNENSIRKTLQFTRVSFTSYSPASLYFNLYSSFDL